MTSLVWFAFIGLLLFVAVSDITRYRIPNWASLALTALFTGVLLWRHADAWPWHLGAFALALMLGLAFFAFRQVGAGDAKFFAAVALWAGFGALIPLLFWTGVGGLIELAILTIIRQLVGRTGGPLPRVLVKRQGVPFGAGIALGAVIASFWFPAWLWTA